MVRSAPNWDKAAAFVLFFFFLPFIVYSLCGPDFYAFGTLDFYYRFVQIGLAGALAVPAYMLARQHGLRFSSMAMFVSGFLVLSLLVHLMLFTVQHRPNFNFEVWKLTTQFVFSFLTFDLLARRFSFEALARATIPLAVVLIVIATIHLTFFAIDYWGRSLYFGLHPNLGGELIFGAICMIAFSKFPLLRWACYAMALYCVMELQARSATVAIAFIVAVAEAPRAGKMIPTFLMVGAAGVATLSFLLLVNPDVAQSVIDFVSHDVLRTNDPYRGAGTGFAGREETFEVAFRDLFARPLTGTGLYNSSVTLAGTPIHNGYLRNLAEFGVLGMLLNLVIFIGALLAFKKDPRLTGVILACAFMFVFGARNFGLSVFPFLMWIAILPWAPREAEQGEPAGRLARRRRHAPVPLATQRGSR